MASATIDAFIRRVDAIHNDSGVRPTSLPVSAAEFATMMRDAGSPWYVVADSQGRALRVVGVEVDVAP